MNGMFWFGVGVSVGVVATLGVLFMVGQIQQGSRMRHYPVYLDSQQRRLLWWLVDMMQCSERMVVGEALRALQAINKTEGIVDAYVLEKERETPKDD